MRAGTVVGSMSLEVRQGWLESWFQLWASRFALSLNFLIYEDNGMFITGLLGRGKWSYEGQELNTRPGMYSVLHTWKLLPMRSILPLLWFLLNYGSIWSAFDYICQKWVPVGIVPLHSHKTWLVSSLHSTPSPSATRVGFPFKMYPESNCFSTLLLLTLSSKVLVALTQMIALVS